MKKGDVLPPLLFSCALESAVRWVQANQTEIKWYTSVLIYAHDNIFGEIIYTVRKNTETLVMVSKEIGLEVNAEKTKYTVMSRDQNAGQNSNIQIGNKSF